MLRTLIVDDEQHCTDRIVKLLENYADKFTLLGSCDSVETAKESIIKLSPDVVFLDVQLHERTGFDLLAQLPQINFEVIFTTAYDNYAVKAFRFSALDYLLKPVDSEEFGAAIQKIIKKDGLKNTSNRLEVLFENFESKVVGSRKVAIPTLEGLTFIKMDDIVRCQSDGNYTHLFLNDNKKLTATKTLKYFEEMLDDYQFFRVHKSHYINISYIDKYLKGKGGYVQMTDGSHIEVAVRRKEEFLKKMTR